MTTLTTVHPAPVAMPRGAVWAPRSPSLARRRAAAVRRRGARRGARAAQDAEALRHYASSFRESDPGFAADLYAAADRHDAQG